MACSADGHWRGDDDVVGRAGCGRRPARVTEVANYQGADREQRLVEGAKREGSLTLYPNAPTDDNTALVGGFEKKYGIKVNLYRASSEKILPAHRERSAGAAIRRRLHPQQRAGHGGADQRKAAGRSQVAACGRSHAAGDAAAPEWVGSVSNVLVQAYNTNSIKKSGLAEDLCGPARSQMEGQDRDRGRRFDWFAGLMAAMGEEKGLKLFRDIVDTNGFSVRKGHTLLNNLVSAG